MMGNCLSSNRVRSFEPVPLDDHMIEAAIQKIKQEEKAKVAEAKKAKKIEDVVEDTHEGGIAQIKLGGWLQVSIHQGDITSEQTDAIFNPSNERLQHSDGLPALLVKKGGE